MDPYRAIAPYYDHEHAGFADDVNFYLNVVRYGPVLEVGAGTGRIMLPLLRSGLEVWGIDTSEAMLRRARERLASYSQAHLLHVSAQQLSLDVHFGAILLPLNLLWHLRDGEEQLAALANLRRHLSDGGLLAVDLSNPFTMLDREAHGELRQRFVTAVGGGQVAGFSAAWDDRAEQRLSLSLLYDETAEDGTVRRTEAGLQLRYLYRFELELLLRLSGWRLDHLYGSYDLEAYSDLSPNLIAIASGA